jgi:galactokinase
VLGVLAQLDQAGIHYGPFDLTFGGDIPIGAGLSSSAAVEAGTLFTVNELFGLGLDTLSMAKMAQKAEHEFAGVRCGIMDQFANLFGRKDHLIELDCRSLDHRLIPFRAKNLRIVLCDTHVKHSLASSEYNTRRAQCEAGVAALGRSLRDTTPDSLEARRSSLDPTVYNRCLHVVRENERVKKTCAALERDDFRTVGQLMYESHASLRDLYEVSCAELDALVEIASKHPGVLGARMMGGGFGGCTINLVEEGAVESLREIVSALAPAVYLTVIAGGTCRVELGS